jgi:hypothetical protein
MELTDADLDIRWSQATCRAFIKDGVIHAAGWWALLCYEENDDEGAEYLLRHELAHHVVNEHEDVADAFKLPEYPSPVRLAWLRLQVGIQLMKYEDIHPEEHFAERVAKLSPRTMKKLARVVAQ